MYKRGVITDEISQDLHEVVELATRYGLDGIELRSVWDKNVHELSDASVNEVLQIAEKAGLEICGISSPVFKCTLGTSEVDEHLDILRRTIEIAKRWQVKIIRGFCFWKDGELNQALPEIAKNLKQAGQLVREAGMTLALESDPHVFTTNGAQLVEVVRTVDLPKVRVLWDPGNDIYDPEGERPFPDGYELVKDYMVHMHLKDAKRLSDGTVVGVPLGQGDVDYVGQFEALSRDGYSGYVVLETHYRPRHEISDELMARPRGSAFSYMGYEATEECLKAWDEL